jgi:hypothetical protein
MSEGYYYVATETGIAGWELGTPVYTIHTDIESFAEVERRVRMVVRRFNRPVQLEVQPLGGDSYVREYKPGEVNGHG